MTQQVVSFYYTLKNKDGEVLDQSQPGAPITYMEGTGMIIEGLEAEIAKLNKGDMGDAMVRPEKGYGFRDESQIDVVSLDQLPVDDVKIGDFFQTGPDQSSPIVRVIQVDGDQVTLDANHPLAGEDLYFSVEVEDKRDATEEEVAHGHPHVAQGGCCGGGGHDNGGGGCCNDEAPEAESREGGCCGGGGEAKAEAEGESHGGCGCSH
mgnify:CR=1 FL=1